MITSMDVSVVMKIEPDSSAQSVREDETVTYKINWTRCSHDNVDFNVKDSC